MASENAKKWELRQPGFVSGRGDGMGFADPQKPAGKLIFIGRKAGEAAGWQFIEKDGEVIGAVTNEGKDLARASSGWQIRVGGFKLTPSECVTLSQVIEDAEFRKAVHALKKAYQPRVKAEEDKPQPKTATLAEFEARMAKLGRK